MNAAALNSIPGQLDIEDIDIGEPGPREGSCPHRRRQSASVERGTVPPEVVADLVGVRVVYAHIWPSNLDPNRVWGDSQEIHDILDQFDGE